MTLASGEWTSLRIPIVPKGLYMASVPMGDIDDTFMLKENLKVLFYHRLRIGVVSRIDLVTSEDKEPKLSAYIHFEHWLDTDEARALRKQLETPGEQYRIYGFPTPRGMREFHFKKNGNETPGYLPLNINKAPIPEYTGPLNIHQLWAKVCYYEEEAKKAAEAAEEEAKEADMEAAYEIANAYFDKLREEEEAKGVYELEWPIDYIALR